MSPEDFKNKKKPNDNKKTPTKTGTTTDKNSMIKMFMLKFTFKELTSATTSAWQMKITTTNAQETDLSLRKQNITYEVAGDS